eukprot:COSAG01_NODE_5835_length_4005_cov_1.677163_3_plen_160_part_00
MSKHVTPAKVLQCVGHSLIVLSCTECVAGHAGYDSFEDVLGLLNFLSSTTIDAPSMLSDKLPIERPPVQGKAELLSMSLTDLKQHARKEGIPNKNLDAADGTTEEVKEKVAELIVGARAAADASPWVPHKFSTMELIPSLCDICLSFSCYDACAGQIID